MCFEVNGAIVNEEVLWNQNKSLTVLFWFFIVAGKDLHQKQNETNIIKTTYNISRYIFTCCFLYRLL